MSPRPRLVASLLLLLAFWVGGMAGMALEEALGLDWFDFLDEDDGPAQGQLLAGLELSAEQRERINEILDAQEERLEDFWESRLPEMRPIVAESYDRIRAVLTPEQRQQFDARVSARGITVPANLD
jgi:Spy/CpxP family protein refolding chaperone